MHTCVSLKFTDCVYCVCRLQGWNVSYMASECSIIRYFKTKNFKISGEWQPLLASHAPSAPVAPWSSCLWRLPLFKEPYIHHWLLHRCWLQHRRRLRLLEDDLKWLLWQWPLQQQWLRLLLGQAPSPADPGILGAQLHRLQ